MILILKEMKKLFVLIFLAFASFANAQQKIHVPANLLLQLRIPIQPDDKSWAKWNEMRSPDDSTKIIRIDRMAQGFAPFIARHDAPYYGAAQVAEIQQSLEKIMNPDLYFASQEEYMNYFRSFQDEYVFRKDPAK